MRRKPACGSGQCAGEAIEQEALIAHLKLEIEKLRRTLYGARSERSARLLDQLELELEVAASADELAAEKVAGKTQRVRSFELRRPVRQPFPDDIEQERVVLPARTQWRVDAAVEAGEGVTSTLQGDRHGAGEVRLRGLRGDHSAAGAVLCDAGGYIGPQLLATILFDQCGPMSAVKPTEPAL